ncbi:hypothetical protein [Spirosoma sordidisoli]|uniref:Uncharacterized protein n=1 Tax=Spirosoma sordidisoli TaxID=2502893 RepID=A0A4Q2UBG0_9BACT|nr:hypothetical protein [Spirosoma sordidisoli]RYC66257.1 hypothetical protein EQG79_30610 [Spirosoma sordidisoli]
MKTYEKRIDVEREKVTQDYARFRDRQYLLAFCGGIIGLFGCDFKDLKSRFLLITGLAGIATSIFIGNKAKDCKKQAVKLGPQEIVLPRSSARLEDLPDFGEKANISWREAVRSNDYTEIEPMNR